MKRVLTAGKLYKSNNVIALQNDIRWGSGGQIQNYLKYCPFCGRSILTRDLVEDE